mmetsp:Transcript_119429/g.207930  ORF Transcript_119429/g.207930 Transcript_119429/m.207930 type:complete len:85 (-) Transcript_119429:81-335(-)
MALHHSMMVHTPKPTSLHISHSKAFANISPLAQRLNWFFCPPQGLAAPPYGTVGHRKWLGESSSKLYPLHFTMWGGTLLSVVDG